MKANKRASLEGNFWDLRWIHGRLAGKPQVDADETKARHQKKKDRLRVEQRVINRHKHSNYPLYDTMIKAKDRMTHGQKPTKRQKTHDQIQYGFDIANWMMEQHA